MKVAAETPCSLVHEGEQFAEVNLVVLAASDNLVDECLEFVEDGRVWDLLSRPRFLRAIDARLTRVLLNELLHVKYALQVTQRVVCLLLVDSAVELSLACAVNAARIN